MRFSGTFLTSITARRIVVLVFVTTVVPLALMTALSLKNLKSLNDDYQHQTLVNQSKDYAISTFGKLTFLENSLDKFATLSQADLEQELKSMVDQHGIFDMVMQIDPQQALLFKAGNTALEFDLKTLILSNTSKDRPDKISIVLYKAQRAGATPVIFLVKNIFKGKTITSQLVTQVNSQYLWGPKTEYPGSTNVCVYSNDNASFTMLFCSGEPAISSPKLDDTNSTEDGSWQLFLRGEFNSFPWLFSVHQSSPTDNSRVIGFMKNYEYIGVALLSLLFTGLLSIRRIKNTMAPLEKLVEGAHEISAGNFSPVNIADNSEFSELANTFNQMSSNIKQKINTLEALSNLDNAIVTNLDVDQLITQIYNRMHALKPNAAFYTFIINEKTRTDALCNLTSFKNDIYQSARVSIALSEVELIKSYEQGQVVTLTNNTVYGQKLVSYGETQCWLLPILWQNEIRAFLAVGCPIIPNAEDSLWQEFRELAKRIGIAISAQTREDTLIRQAQHDILTGLPNRILLEDRLNQAIEFSLHTGSPIWVVFLDLDSFKYINDTLGHNVGDSVLQEISNRLKVCLREIDTVARFGGDEFIIILHGDAKDNIHTEILNRLIDTVAQPIMINQQELITTCSLGVAVYPDDSTASVDLIKYADVAMYKAKELGKNNFQFFTPSLNDKAETHIRIYTKLRSALANNEFVLLYQPKVDLISNKMVGVEALIRWHNPELGMVSPLNFIPLAEETGLILGIGAWVLRTACEQAQAWQQAGFQLIMSVNVSAKQFVQKDFLELVSNTLTDSKLNPENLDIELTESSLFDNSNYTEVTLKAIRQLGVQISIDDFGTGYSNLAYLNTLPINTLKIDKTFTDGIVDKTQKTPIVDTIISLAQNLKLKIVAEGVENYEQVEYLIAHGCDQIQGYYFSRPVTAAEIESMLNAGKILTKPQPN
jgi:diguanylate cyclase (GGDEF)-like protein